MCILRFDLNRIRAESCDSEKLKTPDRNSVIEHVGKGEIKPALKQVKAAT